MFNGSAKIDRATSGLVPPRAENLQSDGDANALVIAFVQTPQRTLAQVREARFSLYCRRRMRSADGPMALTVHVGPRARRVQCHVG
jgi:hypothetical protein